MTVEFSHVSGTPKYQVPCYFAGVFDGTNLSFYLNGRRVASKKIQPVNRNPGGSPIAHTTTPLVFGGDSASGYNWQGKMDEIVLYDRALSAVEVRRLYETAARNPTD